MQVNENIKELVLDDKTRGMIEALNNESQEAAHKAAMAAVQPYAYQMIGMARMVASERGLPPGDWRVSEDCTKIIRMDAPQQAEFTKVNPKPDKVTKFPSAKLARKK